MFLKGIHMGDIVTIIRERLGSAGPHCGEPLLTAAEALELVSLPAARTLDILALAGMARLACGPDFFNCVIVNAKSGRCPEDCAFCAQSLHHHTGIVEYPLVEEAALLRKAEEAEAAGARRFGIVTSGRALTEQEAAAICRAVDKIATRTGLSVCGSLGMLAPRRARQLHDSGLTRYHHNLETSASFFPHICTTHAYQDDIDTLGAAREAGMEVCAGGIIGLGENWAQRVELAFTLSELAVDSIPINFLNAIAGTRLDSRPKLEPCEALRAIALFRLVNPGKDILIAGGREHVLLELQSWLYAAGANGMMIGNYLTTPGADYARDNSMMRALGVR